MGRPLRVNTEEGWYQAYARGLNRMCLYRDDRDRHHFLELLEELGSMYRVRLHAYEGVRGLREEAWVVGGE